LIRKQFTFCRTTPIVQIFGSIPQISLEKAVSLELNFSGSRGDQYNALVVKVRGNGVPGRQKIAAQRSQAPHSR